MKEFETPTKSTDFITTFQHKNYFASFKISLFVHDYH